MTPDARTAGAADGPVVGLLVAAPDALELDALDDDGLLALAHPLNESDIDAASAMAAVKTIRVVLIS